MLNNLKIKIFLFYKSIINFIYNKYKNIVNKIKYNKRKKKYISEYDNRFGNRFYTLNLIKKIESYSPANLFNKKSIEELSENANHINNIKKKSPCFYDFEIIDIHNENVTTDCRDTRQSFDLINKLMKKECENADLMLSDAEKILKFLENKQDKKLWEKVFGKNTHLRKN